MSKSLQLTDVFIETTNPRMFVEGQWECDEKIDPTNRVWYLVFHRIPYAEPPIGKRRFQPPAPYSLTREHETQHRTQADEGTLEDNMEEMEIDEEIDEAPDEETEDDEIVEDCLYLTVYLPRTSTSKKKCCQPLPVLVYFERGNFRKGLGKYDNILPAFFMMQDIILVTVDYRLGPFGFLNLYDKKCKGNAGLKDQVMALRWVQDNIGAFGGDTKNITISGHSFGGSCVNFHLISPLSRDLFHKAIIQSGGIFCPWGYKGFLDSSRFLYKQFWRMEELMETDAADILEFDQEQYPYFDLMYNPNIMAAHLGPSVEIPGEDAFLPHNMPINDLMKRAKPVPILAGIAEEEGYEGVIDYPGYLDGNNITDDTKFFSLLRLYLPISERAKRHLDNLREIYFPDIDWFEDDLQTEDCYAKLRTDLAFHRFYDNFKIGEQGSAPIYIYKFNYLTGIGPSQEDQSLTDKNHDSDGMEKKKRKIRTIYSLWASFCKTGVPSGALHEHLQLQWMPHTNEKPYYLNIEDDNLNVVNGFLNADRWNYLNRMVVEDYIEALLSPIIYTHGVVIT